jgi:hypothetical protein
LSARGDVEELVEDIVVVVVEDFFWVLVAMVVQDFEEIFQVH